MTRVDRFRVELLNTVYDPAYSEHGPGQILTEAALHWAYSHGLEFDFRIDDAPISGSGATAPARR